MRIETLLNSIEKHKSFVYGKSRLSESGGRKEIEIEVRARKNGRPICSHCGSVGPIYDHCPNARRFLFVPLWGIAVVLLYRLRRVNCSTCGIHVEKIPWAEGQSSLTHSLQIFLATWARRLSWSEVGRTFGVQWTQVRDAVRYVVFYGLVNRDLSGITAIGVDEVAIGRGHRYLTLVYQINDGAKRLLYVGCNRTVKTLNDFFEQLGEERCRALQYVCSDMWKPYLQSIKKYAGGAMHILDRFHIVANVNKALDKIRAAEAKELERQGYEPVLKHTRYCFLKKRGNLTSTQKSRLKSVLAYDLKSVRGYLLKEAFDGLWSYKDPEWARWFLREWSNKVMRSQLQPLKTFVKSLRKHEEPILNWFRAKKKYSQGVVEGLNRKVNLVTRKSYGFRNEETLELALLHAMGDLPEPKTTHRFV